MEGGIVEEVGDRVLLRGFVYFFLRVYFVKVVF